MGLFDNVTCLYPLPMAGANEFTYQTKDLDPGLNHVVIRADGTIWRRADDVDTWEQLLPTREVRFYTMSSKGTGWLEWSAYFLKGELQQINLIEHEP